jgi:hypothetical protein
MEFYSAALAILYSVARAEDTSPAYCTRAAFNLCCEFAKIEAIHMATPQLTPDQIAQVSGLVSQYISTQRERYAPRAVRLSVHQTVLLRPQVAERQATSLMLSGGQKGKPLGHLLWSPVPDC